MLINGFEFQMSLNWNKMRAKDVRPSSCQSKSYLDSFLLLHEFEMLHGAHCFDENPPLKTVRIVQCRGQLVQPQAFHWLLLPLARVRRWMRQSSKAELHSSGVAS